METIEQGVSQTGRVVDKHQEHIEEIIARIKELKDYSKKMQDFSELMQKNLII